MAIELQLSHICTYACCQPRRRGQVRRHRLQRRRQRLRDERRRVPARDGLRLHARHRRLHRAGVRKPADEVEGRPLLCRTERGIRPRRVPHHPPCGRVREAVEELLQRLVGERLLEKDFPDAAHPRSPGAREPVARVRARRAPPARGRAHFARRLRRAAATISRDVRGRSGQQRCEPDADELQRVVVHRQHLAHNPRGVRAEGARAQRRRLDKGRVRLNVPPLARHGLDAVELDLQLARLERGRDHHAVKRLVSNRSCAPAARRHSLVGVVRVGFFGGGGCGRTGGQLIAATGPALDRDNLDACAQPRACRTKDLTRQVLRAALHAEDCALHRCARKRDEVDEGVQFGRGLQVVAARGAIDKLLRESFTYAQPCEVDGGRHLRRIVYTQGAK
mmetsp:Transcript_24849/g.62911  ORF Transcript_24849/g.62911 Transcript_24849/m.62911 type:complete len:392 (-) Transcript_24849:659-1834(-)